MSTPISEALNQDTVGETQLRDLFWFTAGGRQFAVFAEDVEGTVDTKRPAVLPNAPPGVLGVVCVRGRMLTTLDPVALVGENSHVWPAELPCVIALRGDEQLALAADALGETITVAATDIETVTADTEDNARQVITGISRHAGEEIAILNAGNLFAAAVHRQERRRRRF